MASRRRRNSRLRRWIRRIRQLPAWWAASGHPGGFVGLYERRRLRHVTLPSQVWSTKSHEWWVLLGAILRRLQPKSILEVGAGRSSSYLSEYACKSDRLLVSVDQSPEWVAVVRTIARFGGLRDDFVHAVPLEADGYYDADAIARLVTVPPDFVYLDGPNGDRSGLLKRPALLELCGHADALVIDDIQWTDIYDQLEALENLGPPRTRTVIEYEIREAPLRVLALLVRDDLQPTVDELIRCLAIPTLAEFTRSDCVER